VKKEWVDKAVENSRYAREKMEEFAKSYKENPEVIADYLQFSQRFYEYSPRNLRLIYQQNRGATFVKSFADWKKEGVSVKRGETGIAIWVPVQVTLLEVGEGKYIPLREANAQQKADYKAGKIESVKQLRYKVGHIFDIGQTTYPKDQYPKIYNMGSFSDDKEKLIDTLKLFSENELGCTVVQEDLQSIALRGYYCDKKIALNQKLETTETLSTLTHEMGHAMAHNKDKDKGKSTAQKEYEADCVSIVFQSYMGEDISDTRKRHLAENYKRYRRELEKKFVGKTGEELEKLIDKEMESNFDTVHSIIKENLTKLEKYLNNSEFIPKRTLELLEERSEDKGFYYKKEQKKGLFEKVQKGHGMEM
jgi:hypothetical protein